MADPNTDPGNRFADIVEAIQGAGRVGILTHRRPDGDAIGSCIAVAGALRSLGKEVSLINEDEVPDSLAFLHGTEDFQVAAQLGDARITVDLVLVLDAAGVDRVGDVAWNAFDNSGLVINIDHHASNTHFGDLNCVDIEAPATGQIVFELLKYGDWELTEAGRDAIYVAISTDTGSFRYPGSTSETYRIGAELIDLGLDVGAVNQSLYESYPLRRILILKELLKGIEIRCEGRLVALRLTRSMAEAADMRPGDTEGLIDVVRSVGSVIVAVFFEEMEDGKIRVSSRSKSEQMDVGKICAVFGGGGHRLAAGARMPGPIDEAAEKFLNEVAKRFNGFN